MEFDGTSSSPTYLALNVFIGGENVDLNLDVVTDLEPNFPVFTADSSNGTMQINLTTTSPMVNKSRVTRINFVSLY